MKIEDEESKRALSYEHKLRRSSSIDHGDIKPGDKEHDVKKHLKKNCGKPAFKNVGFYEEDDDQTLGAFL
jgi:hypothetical protein